MKAQETTALVDAEWLDRFWFEMDMAMFDPWPFSWEDQKEEDIEEYRKKCEEWEAEVENQRK